MEYIIIAITLFFCIYDFVKRKSFISPIFIFNFIWFFTITLNLFKLSVLQQDLSTRTSSILLVCVISYNITCLIFHKIYEIIKTNKLKNKEEKNKNTTNKEKENKLAFLKKFIPNTIEKKLNIARFIAIVVFIIQIIYSNGLPLIWKLAGGSKTYFNFGITSLNGAWHGLIVCLGAYSLFYKKKDRFLYPIIGILILSRQVILSIIIEAMIFYLLDKSNKLNIKKIIILCCIAVICFLGFNFLGNIRSTGDANVESVFGAKEEYPNIPTSIKWVYSYMTFSISNFNNLVSMTNGAVNYGVSTLNDILPNVILNKININVNFNEDYLISPNFNVSTYLPSLYLDFGIVGIAIFNIIIAIAGTYLYNKNKSDNSVKNRLLYAVFAHNIVFLFFINMFLYLPIIIQIIYILLIFSEKKNKKENEINDYGTVAILMATYNGEKYIEEQVESILNQTYKDFVLYIRDDNSTDNTNNIIAKYVEKYPNRIIKVEDNKIAKGACKNFMFLLEHVYNLNKYEMFMFCDQDDVWLENKVECTINEYQKVDNKEQPILVHTDLNVVDAELNIINESFLEYSNLDGKYIKFNNYLIQNNVTGCTMLINKKLVELLKFNIQDIRMHDWYFALIASAFGKVIFINKKTIKYRQHGKNVLGAKKVKGIKGIYNKLIKNNTIKDDLKKVFEQAESFKQNHYELLSEKNKKILDDFCKIKNSNKIKKIIIINKNNFYKQGTIRKIGEIIFI